MGFRAWGCAKNVILKGLADVCFGFVSRHLVLEGADTFACSDGHDPSKLWVNMSCPYESSRFPG
jgi:hypothetical protein